MTLELKKAISTWLAHTTPPIHGQHTFCSDCTAISGLLGNRSWLASLSLALFSLAIISRSECAARENLVSLYKSTGRLCGRRMQVTPPPACPSHLPLLRVPVESLPRWLIPSTFISRACFLHLIFVDVKRLLDAFLVLLKGEGHPYSAQWQNKG